MNHPLRSRPAFVHSSVRSELGGSLPPVLIAIAVGSILLAPFLAHVSSRMLATQATTDNVMSYYAADSGVEYAIWLLENDPDFVDSVMAALGSPVAAPNNPDINNVATAVNVTAQQSWVAVADTPSSVGSGASMARISGSLFVTRGGGTSGFWRYDTSTDSWTTLASTPDDVNEGGDLTVRDGDTLLALRGDDSNDFWRYRPSTNTWSSLRDTPRSVGPAGSLAYLENGETFAFLSPLICVPPFNPFFCLDPIWRYDEGEDEWDRRAINPDETGTGAALTADGNGNLLALRGDGSDDFWKYTPDSWDSSPSDPGVTVGAGSDLASDEVQYTYFLRGGGTTNAGRYDQNADSWTSLANTPAAIGPGGSIAYAGDDTVYALRGDGTSDFWRLGIVYIIEAYQGGDLKLTTSVRFSGGDAIIDLWDIQ